MNGDLALSQGREEGFLWYYQAQSWGGALCQEELLFTPTCRHGTFEAFVKRGIWQRATRVLSFTNSSLGWQYSQQAAPMSMRDKRWNSTTPFPLNEETWEWCLSYSVIKAPLTWYYEVTERLFFVLVSVRQWLVKSFPHSLLTCLTESWVTFLLHSVLDCLCMWEVQGNVAVYRFYDCKKIKLFSYQICRKMETWLLSYQDICFGQLLPPHCCQIDTN